MSPNKSQECFLFSDIEQKIVKDSVLSSYISGTQKQLSEFEKRSQQQYFSGFWDKYDVKIALFDSIATAAGRERATIQMIKINRREGGAMNVTVRVTSGAAPFEFDPSAFKLKRRDGSLQPGRSASSVVFMEALQPNSSKEYELSFDGPDGVALIAPGHPAIPLPPSGP